MVYESVALACQSFWSASYIVNHGNAWKKSKSGNKVGKPLPAAQLMGDLRDHCPVFRTAAPEAQVAVLEYLLAIASEDETGEGENAYFEEVDAWLVPLLKVFRWRSDGNTVRGFYHKALAKAIMHGADPETAEATKELTPIQVGDEACLATALQGDPMIWSAFEAAYRQMVQDPAVKVTPKSSAGGKKTYHSFRGYLKAMMPSWLSDIRFHIPNEPKAVANSDTEWAFWHFGPHSYPSAFQPDSAQAPTPAWDGWLAKLGNPDRRKVFMAWVFSVCYAKNRSRQVLWLEGRGGDGKGAVMGAIMSFLGDRAASTISEGVFADAHGSAGLYGYRLLVNPECKNARFLSYALVHQITGGDKVLMNPKFGQPFSVRMDAKIAVLANCPPDMDIYNMHESSRMAYLFINPDSAGADRSHLAVDSGGNTQLRGDIKFESRLLAEMPAFLAKAMVAYEELCPTHGNIILPGTVVNDMSDRCASHEQERFERLYDDNFEANPLAWMDSHLIKDVFERMMPNGSKGNMVYAAFIKYIESKGHKKIRPEKHGKRVRGFKGICPKGARDYNQLADVILHKGHVGVDEGEY